MSSGLESPAPEGVVALEQFDKLPVDLYSVPVELPLMCTTGWDPCRGTIDRSLVTSGTRPKMP